MKDYYMFKGEKRFYYPADEVTSYKPGTTVVFPTNEFFVHQKVSGCTAEILSAYYTKNRGFKNYGRVVRILTGIHAGKTLRIQT